MTIMFHDCGNIRVWTQSGRCIGVLFGVELDTETHQVRRYHVGAVRWFFFRTILCLIDPSQVISLSKDSMIVIDAVVAEKPASYVAIKTIPEDSFPQANSKEIQNNRAQIFDADLHS